MNFSMQDEEAAIEVADPVAPQSRLIETSAASGWIVIIVVGGELWIDWIAGGGSYRNGYLLVHLRPKKPQVPAD